MNMINVLKNNSKVLSQKEKDLQSKVNRKIIEEHSKSQYSATQPYEISNQKSYRNKALDLKSTSSQSKGKIFIKILDYSDSKYLQNAQQVNKSNGII